MINKSSLSVIHSLTYHKGSEIKQMHVVFHGQRATDSDTTLLWSECYIWMSPCQLCWAKVFKKPSKNHPLTTIQADLIKLINGTELEWHQNLFCFHLTCSKGNTNVFWTQIDQICRIIISWFPFCVMQISWYINMAIIKYHIRW